jgi:hypothetical protein
MADSTLYDTDITGWATRQAALLRRRAAGELVNDAELDWTNIAEEIEDVARRQKDRLYGALASTCEHLLKWQYQPDMRSGSWRSAVAGARDRIAKLIEDSPTLRDYPAQVLARAYVAGWRRAQAETSIETLPKICPWTIEQVLNDAFWPETPGGSG